MAMLYAFDVISKEMGLRLLIAHMNHCLRGAESDRDQAYVEAAGRSLNIPVAVCRQNTKKFSRLHKLNLESAARRQRYDFFSRLGEEHGIEVIATAHTEDDQSETVLMRIIRGAGLRGLSGIPVKNVVSKITVIRPLIDVSRREIQLYLASKNIRPRIDSSNREPKFFRNRIRLSLLPLLQRDYNPDIKDCLLNTAELARRDYEYLDFVYKNKFKRLARIKADGGIVFLLADIGKQYTSVKRGLIRQAIGCLRGSLDNIEYRHWKEIESLIQARRDNAVVNLPNNIIVEKAGRRLRIAVRGRQKNEARQQDLMIAKIPFTAYFGSRRFNIRRVRRMPDLVKKPRFVEYISIKNSDMPLVLRCRRHGDRIRPLGMSGYKKVSDLFIDDKIPRLRRSHIPVLASSAGDILCIPGIRISDRCRVKSTSSDIVRLELLTR